MQRTDSIRENMTKADMIATLEAELSADIEHKLNIVLVEGSDDVLFGRQVLEAHVVFYESFCGKEGLKELLETPSLADHRMIAVRDKDYADEDTFPDNMFAYDACCLEMMLLKSEEVLNSFCRVYCGNVHSGNDILISVMRNLAPYSIARKKNEEHNLRIAFRAGFGNLICENDFLIDELFQRTSLPEDFKEACKTEADALSAEDLYNITNGHDICKYLSCISEDKRLGEADVRRILICAYRKDDFQKTRLYESLKTYQRAYHLAFVR